MNPIQWIKDYAYMLVIAALVLVIAGLGIRLWGVSSALADTKVALAQTQGAFDKHLGEDAEAARQMGEDYRERERLLQRGAEKSKELLNEQVVALRAERDDFAGQLRKRPARPAAGPTFIQTAVAAAPSGGEVPGCTAAELYEQDASAAFAIAVDAEQLRLDYLKLWGDYERAREQLEKVNQP